MLGSYGCGKSALVLRFVTGNFSEGYDETIEDRYQKCVRIDYKTWNLIILDTGGQQQFNSMRDQWIREGQIFIIVYSITNRASFDEVFVLRDKILRCKEVDEFPMYVII